MDPMTTLQLNSSLFGPGGQSTTLANELVASRGGKVIVRDLAKDPLPHLDAARFGAFLAKPGERTPEQQAMVKHSDSLIAELKAADTIVIGLPMYNFGIPSTLKAWFDHVLRAGVTFAYTAEGPKGLVENKRAIVVETRGGLYSEGPAKVMDFQEPYLRQLFGFIGITDVTFVRAEKIGFGLEARDQAIEAARALLADLLSGEVRAAA